MNVNVFYDLIRQALWLAVVISAPMLIAALVVGVVVGLLQAVTSIQEMTLTFLPKLTAMLIVFWASMSFMTDQLTGFFNEVVIKAILAF